MREEFMGQGTGANLRLRKQLREGIEQLKAGELDAARATFSDIIASTPDSAMAHLGLGIVHFLENDVQAALQCFQEALKRDPTSSMAKVFIARAREELGDVDAAMDDYEEAN